MCDKLKIEEGIILMNRSEILNVLHDYKERHQERYCFARIGG